MDDWVSIIVGGIMALLSLLVGALTWQIQRLVGAIDKLDERLDSHDVRLTAIEVRGEGAGAVGRKLNDHGRRIVAIEVRCAAMHGYPVVSDSRDEERDD